MKRFYKIFLALMLSFMMIFSIGCAKNTNKSNDNSKNSITSSEKKSNSKDTKKESKDTNKKAKKEDIKKEKKIEDKKENKSNNKSKNIEKKDGSSSVNDKKTETKNTVKKENANSTSKKAPAKKESKKTNSVSEEKPKEEDTFTMIIGKDIKGYTGKPSSVVNEFTLKVEESKNAMTYLRENTSMQENGGFIFEIDGIHNFYPIPENKKTPEQKEKGVMGIDWFIYLNGKKTPVGANDVYVKKGDVLLFDFHEWDKREFLPPED